MITRQQQTLGSKSPASPAWMTLIYCQPVFILVLHILACFPQKVEEGKEFCFSCVRKCTPKGYRTMETVGEIENWANSRVHYNAAHGLAPRIMHCSLFQDKCLRDHKSYSNSRQFWGKEKKKTVHILSSRVNSLIIPDCTCMDTD